MQLFARHRADFPDVAGSRSVIDGLEARNAWDAWRVDKQEDDFRFRLGDQKFRVRGKIIVSTGGSVSFLDGGKVVQLLGQVGYDAKGRIAVGPGMGWSEENVFLPRPVAKVESLCFPALVGCRGCRVGAIASPGTIECERHNGSPFNPVHAVSELRGGSGVHGIIEAFAPPSTSSLIVSPGVDHQSQQQSLDRRAALRKIVSYYVAAPEEVVFPPIGDREVLGQIATPFGPGLAYALEPTNYKTLCSPGLGVLVRKADVLLATRSQEVPPAIAKCRKMFAQVGAAVNPTAIPSLEADTLKALVKNRVLRQSHLDDSVMVLGSMIVANASTSAGSISSGVSVQGPQCETVRPVGYVEAPIVETITPVKGPLDIVRVRHQSRDWLWVERLSHKGASDPMLAEKSVPASAWGCTSLWPMYGFAYAGADESVLPTDAVTNLAPWLAALPGEILTEVDRYRVVGTVLMKNATTITNGLHGARTRSHVLGPLSPLVSQGAALKALHPATLRAALEQVRRSKALIYEALCRFHPVVKHLYPIAHAGLNAQRTHYRSYPKMDLDTPWLAHEFIEAA